MPEQRGCGRWGRGCSGVRSDDFQGLGYRALGRQLADMIGVY